ncbi:MAG TPA: hypothetical protein VFR78_03300 [Pyrinomonadaceae bacterium]|nr:hypothetical protein [Pyrinomonadaceae bacterium]
MSLLNSIITRERIVAAVAFTGAIAIALLLFSWPNLRNYRQALFVDSALEGNVSLMQLGG